MRDRDGFTPFPLRNPFQEWRAPAQMFKPPEGAEMARPRKRAPAVMSEKDRKLRVSELSPEARAYRKEQDAAWRAANREKIAAQRRDQYARQRAAQGFEVRPHLGRPRVRGESDRSGYMRGYYQENRERILENMRARRQARQAALRAQEEA